MKIEAKVLKTFKDKTLGLMFSNNKTPVYFETRFGIHTLFLKSPIDVFILDENFIVRKIKRNLKPFRIFYWNPKYFRVLEIPLPSKTSKEIKLHLRINI